MTITVRSAVFCTQVEVHGQTVDYLGVLGGVLRAESEPGYLMTWFALQLGLAGARGSSRLVIEAAGLSIDQALELPASQRFAMVAFPIMIPVLAPGPLTVSLRSRGQPTQVLRWDLGYVEGAQRLDPLAESKIVSAAAEANSIINLSLSARGRQN